MDNEPLDIQDSDRSTKGGPPGWMAFAVIIGAASLIAVVVMVFSFVL